jgi:hypothetical protein
MQKGFTGRHKGATMQISDYGAYLHGDGDPVDLANRKNEENYTARGRMLPNKQEILDLIKEQMASEFSAMQDYLSGRINRPAIKGDPLLFFEFPDCFESRIAILDGFPGELTEIDMAWIKNSRGLIQKYHEAVYMQGNIKELVPA